MGNELLLCGPCLPPGRTGRTTWASDLGLTLAPRLSGGHASGSIRIAFQLQLQPLSSWQRLGFCSSKADGRGFDLMIKVFAALTPGSPVIGSRRGSEECQQCWGRVSTCLGRVQLGHPVDSKPISFLLILQGCRPPLPQLRGVHSQRSPGIPSTY